MNRLALDDAAVIDASRAEPDRFASLFDRHAPYIHRYLARRVGRQAADDLVAETFLVAFRKRAGYDRRYHDARPGSTASPPTWSPSIAAKKPASSACARLRVPVPYSTIMPNGRR